MQVQPSDVEVLAENECWRLLRTAVVGRLAVVLEGELELLPVNYRVDHGTVVFRTGVGSTLSLSGGHRVAFEADGVDMESGLAWSVVLKGQAHQVKSLHEVLDTFELSLAAWQAGPKPVFVRITPDGLTGRRFQPAWRVEA